MAIDEAFDDCERPLFGLRYLSGVALPGADNVGGARFMPLPERIVEFGLGLPDDARVEPPNAESSLVPGLWLKEERSDELEEDVVDTEAGAGYRDRDALPASDCFRVGTELGAELVLMFAWVCGTLPVR